MPSVRVLTLQDPDECKLTRGKASTPNQTLDWSDKYPQGLANIVYNRPEMFL